jgi:hypothetical protein
MAFVIGRMNTAKNFRRNTMANATMFRSKSPLSNEQIQRYAPSVFAAEAHETRSERYTYIPTIDILQGLRAEGFEPMAVGQTRVRDESKRDFTKHMLRFRHAGGNMINIGDEVAELVLVNSHDGASAYSLTGGIYRLVCSNGMVVGDETCEVKVRHSGNVLENVIEGSFRVIEDLKQIAPVINEWKGIQLAPRETVAFAEAALDLRWDHGTAPIDATQLLGARRYEDHGSDLWKIFNKTQENLIRGGLRGRGATGRRLSTRAVGSVTENIRLNKSLWSLTQKMAELKAA